MDKIIKRRDGERKFRENIFQSNVITKSLMPFTKLESNLFVLLLSTLQKDTLTYEISVKQIMEILKITKSNYKSIIEGLEGLYDKSIVISNGSKVKKIRLLSMIEYDKVLSDDGYVRLEVCHSIIPFLFNLKNNFSVFSLSSYLQLKTTQAKRIYQLLAQYKSLKTFTIDVNQLQSICGVHYADTPKFLYSLKKPIEEIEKTTNIEKIRITKVKAGRKVVKLIFSFNWLERQIPLDFPLTIETDVKSLKLYSRLMDDFQQTQKNTIKILENIPHKDIRKSLETIQMGFRDGRIKNIGSYTYKYFENNFDLI